MLSLKIVNKDKQVLLEKTGKEELYLVYNAFYNDGDSIILTSNETGLYEVKLDAALDTCVVYLTGEYEFSIPFNEKKFCYPELSFSGEKNLISVRKAPAKAVNNYKNLALNVYDHHLNSTMFPHSFANVETRGESVFASRNAMDGNFASDSHGKWPYESWGINRNSEAEMTIDFGRPVKVDTLVLYTRADFPHDAWWTKATITFNDGESLVVDLEKKDGAQRFNIEEKIITSLTISSLIKADDPSPFPALIQLEAWGSEV